MVEAVLDEPRQVRCCDCRHRHKLIPKRGRFNRNGRDKYCAVNINGVVLLNAMRNDQALRAWRKCPNFEWDKEKES